MARTLMTWGGRAAAAIIGLLLLVVVVAGTTDRPSADPVVIDREAPEVTALLEAERAWLAHHGLEHATHDVTVDDRGLRVRVLEVGAGPPVVLLPGGSGEAAYFAPLLEHLDGHRFLVATLPGGGGSDGVDLRAVDHRDLAIATLDAIYNHFDLESAPLVANSRGGAWALWYGLDRPDRVSATTHLGVPAGVEGTTVPAALGLLGVPGLNRIVASTLLAIASPEDAGEGLVAFGHPRATVDALPDPARDYQYAEHQLPTFSLTWRSLGQDSFRLAGLAGWDPGQRIHLDDLAGLDHPILLIWPPNDPFASVEVGHVITEHFPDAELHVAGAGHLPWLDDPAGVAQLVAGFLDAHEPDVTPPP